MSCVQKEVSQVGTWHNNNKNRQETNYKKACWQEYIGQLYRVQILVHVLIGSHVTVWVPLPTYKVGVGSQVTSKLADQVSK